MPMSATTRPKGLGPADDPGLQGWDAMGQGIHFTLGNGQAGGLLGNLPWEQRLSAAHAGDANAGWSGNAQSDLSLLGANYGGTPHSIFAPGELDQINAFSMATNAAERARQPLVAANGMSLLTPAQQAAGGSLDSDGQLVGGPWGVSNFSQSAPAVSGTNNGILPNPWTKQSSSTPNYKAIGASIQPPNYTAPVAGPTLPPSMTAPKKTGIPYMDRILAEHGGRWATPNLTRRR